MEASGLNYKMRFVGLFYLFCLCRIFELDYVVSPFVTSFVSDSFQLELIHCRCLKNRKKQ